MTGRIYGYAHNFCNMKLIKNQSQFSCIAHNFFNSVWFFLIKGIRLSIWRTKNINIGRSGGLTNVNLANIGSQVKFIDTMKYFLTSLGKLASTLEDNVEKAKKLTLWINIAIFHRHGKC